MSILKSIAISFFTISPMVWSNEYYIIVASDAQYPRTGQGFNDSESERLNRNSVASINKLKDELKDKLKFAIINGDLTEYGHDNERHKFNEIYSQLKLPAYLGLGNHDYANNVGDCWSTQIDWLTMGYNGCASQMLNFIEGKIKSMNPTRFDYNYEKDNIGRKALSGSWSYSWDFENVHFVQLNNYPSYQREWKIGPLKYTSYNIKSSLDWLEEDLKLAKQSRSHKIVINLHDPWEHWEYDAKVRFKNIINNNQVSIVFAGHFHNLFGQYSRSDIYGDVPLFLSGALFENNFFLVHFSDNSITVQKYNGVDGVPTTADNPTVFKVESENFILQK